MAEEKPTDASPLKARSRLIIPILVVILGIAAVLARTQQAGSGVEPPAEVAAGETATPRPGSTPAATASGGAPLPVPVSATAATPDPDDNGGGPDETAEPTPAATGQPIERPEGALIAIHFQGQVGVLLDELPVSMRERVTEALLAQPEEFWRERAERQIELTMYRLTFRNFFYSDKGQLPLPPKALWQFEFDPAGPARQGIQRHDLVVLNYTFATTLLTDAASAGAAESALADSGGIWEEPFTLPIDPELLLQRTGNACINEGGFPPNSVDSENAWQFYDQTCLADSGGPLGCHRVRLASESCFQALDQTTGLIQSFMRFERLEWADALADEFRLGDLTAAGAPDLAVVGQDLEYYRVIYRYFAADSCALIEQCVAGSGWRRLLQFDATVHNVGGEALHIGPVIAEDPANNLFQYNACHDHFHFSNYGDFLLGDTEQQASKQAFCVESTGRASNNEWSPLTHPYSCRFQGVQAGWVDEYTAGLDCQWIDITDLFPTTPLTATVAAPLASTAPISAPLVFNANPDAFLCEGTPVLDEEGNPVWEPSGLVTADGRPINRPQCDFLASWDANNSASRDVSIAPFGSFVTEPCGRHHLGPRRNCGFTPLLEAGSDVTFACTPGREVTLSCAVPASAAPQVLRVCETSNRLGTGTACVYEEATANITVGANDSELTFTCPAPRDETEPGGLFSFYSAPVFPADDPAPISCTLP